MITTAHLVATALAALAVGPQKPPRIQPIIIVEGLLPGGETLACGEVVTLDVPVTADATTAGAATPAGTWAVRALLSTDTLSYVSTRDFDDAQRARWDAVEDGATACVRARFRPTLLTGAGADARVYIVHPYEVDFVL